MQDRSDEKANDQSENREPAVERSALADDERLTRRQLLQLTSLTVAGAALGCGGGGGDVDPSDADVEADTADAEADATDADDAPDSGDGDIDADEPTDADHRPDDAEADVEADAESLPPAAGPLFIVHLSDTHIGAQAMSVPALTLGLTEVPEAVQPDLTVISGDLVDEGDHEEMWLEYEDTIALTTAAETFEVPGNHDTHNDYALSGFLRHSLTGQATATTFTIRFLEAKGRRIRVVGINTASADDQLRNLTGFLDAAQVDDLIARIEAEREPVDRTIIIGHHPMRGINGLELYGTAGNLRRLIEASEASAYLFGHVHLYQTSWVDEVLHVQNATLGNPSIITTAGFCILGIDDSGLSLRQVPLEVDGSTVSVDWPRVLITSPADTGLGGGNPTAPRLPRSTAGQRLRAGVFCPGLPDEVTFRIGSGTWQPMSPVETWYEADFETTAADSMTIEVRAVFAGASDSHSIRVRLE